MQRRLAPEPLDTAEQAKPPARADFSDADDLFIRLLERHWPERGQARRDGCQGIALGRGSGNILMRFLRAWPKAQCTAVQENAAMLAQARELLDTAPNLKPRAHLVETGFSHPSLGHGGYDLILANGLLHSLPRPEVLWESIRRLGRPGAFVLIMDLARPPEPSWVEALLKTYANEEPEAARVGLRQALRAAFEPAEVQTQIRAAGLAEALEARVVGDRHLAVWGHLPA